MQLPEKKKHSFTAVLVLLVLACTVGVLLAGLLARAMKGVRMLYLILQQISIIIFLILAMCRIPSQLQTFQSFFRKGVDLVFDNMKKADTIVGCLQSF